MSVVAFLERECMYAVQTREKAVEVGIEGPQKLLAIAIPQDVFVIWQ
jgi:hypothetical protein